MEKYEKYKDSGVTWIGMIPDSWSTFKMKHFFYMKGRIGWQGLKADEFISEGPYLVTGTDFENGRVCWDRCYHISEDRYNEAPEIHVKLGDVLITKDGTVGKLAFVDQKPEKVSLNSHLLILRSTIPSINNEYVFWALQSSLFKHYTGLTQTGSIMESLSQEKISYLSLPWPSLDEQQAMVNYLNSECSRIDSLIATQQKRVELLKELRQSVITKAVTKGLNPNAKMKDSGVEWIGEVPEHWKVVDLKYMWSSYKSGPFGSALITEKLLPEGSILVYTPEHIAKHSICLENNLFLPESRRNEMSQFLVSAGDILVPIVGTLGRAMIVDSNMQEGIINQRLSKFKVDESVIEKDYLLLLISDTTLYKQFIDANSRGSIIVNLTKEILGNIPIILPPIEEQRRIVGSVKEQMTKIDSMINSVQRKCTLLKEYKQSLISEVVTGKRKVC